LNKFDGFIKPIESFYKGEWQWKERVYRSLCKGWDPTLGHGLENIISYLPDLNLMREKVEANSIDVYQNKDQFDTISNELIKNYNIPLVRGLSDFFIIKNKYISNFIEYLKFFTAIDLFPEVSIPTALAATVDNLCSNFTDSAFKFCILWGDDRIGGTNSSFVNDFFIDKNSVYLHPCKFSLIDDKYKFFTDCGYI